MGKPRITKKKNSLPQSKISNYFKKQTTADFKYQSLQNQLISNGKLNRAKGDNQEADNIPVIVLDDSVTTTPKSATLNDSSLEFIAATPESDKKSMFFSNLTNSPDMIPPTPMPVDTNKSRICLNKKFSTIGSNSTYNSYQIQGTACVKRIADSKTGMSPKTKRSDYVNVEQKNKACLIKKNILKEISASESLSDSDSSPSLLQSFLKPIKIPPKRTKLPLCINTSVKSNQKEHNIPNHTDFKTDTISHKLTVHSLQNEDKDEIVKKKYENELRSMEINVEKPNFGFDDIDMKFLAANIDQLSPFKDRTVQTESKWNSIFEKEKIKENSFAASANYNRHLVTLVDKRTYNSKIVLTVKSLYDGRNCVCNLSGFWYDSHVKEGDIVNILLTDKEDGAYNITNTKGLIVLNPDVLVSGTSVVAGVFCRRKAILNEKFKGVDSGNRLMLIGSLVHELFQSIVSMKDVKEVCLKDMVRKLVIQKQILLELYGLKIKENEITEEIISFLPAIQKWRNTYMKGLEKYGEGEWKGSVCDVVDIEENVWSPRFGIKGKIDLTVRTTHKGRSKIMPLELKTGKSSYSAEHKGQLTLYSMMSSDRRKDPQAGLLLYLKNLSMKEIPAGEMEKKGLIQLRNELVSYMHQKQENVNMPSLPSLPEPLDNKRLCEKCPQLLTCSMMLTVQNQVPQGEHAMSELARSSVAHLSQSHLDYFRHWCLLLHLEIWRETCNIRNKALWCKDAEEREEMGECIGSMVLSVEKPIEECDGSKFLHHFNRESELYRDIPKKSFIPGDSVIISSRNEIAIGIGVVGNISETGVSVILDRNLQKYPLWKSKVFRIDRCEYQSTMGIVYTNLVTLLQEGTRFDNLRELLIDRRVPKFCEGFDKSKVPLMKPILKNLNKNQQRAVLRVLLAEDYLILKGFPGTGKTSTVVCLVRLLVLFGFSVLLTSYTHSAVDTVLLKLKEHDDCPFLRIGRISKINPELHQYSEDVLLKNVSSVNEVKDVLDSKPLIATTCLAVNHPVFKRRSFDYCIIDEAAQVLQPVAIGPLFQCKKFVLVGDSLQLPPVVQSHIANKQGMSQTLLERLDCEAGTMCLTQQYRMNTEIQRIANELTYKGQLECATDVIAEATLPSNTTLSSKWLERVTSSLIEDSVIFLDTKGISPEGMDRLKHPVNSGESDIISSVVEALLNCGIAKDAIGVMTPYRGQVNLLRRSFEDVEINTVDQFQGRDRLVILYSCVKSSSNGEVKDNEILNDERRLNVAITRAKCKLVFVGDRITLNRYTPFEKLFNILNSNQFINLDG